MRKLKYVPLLAAVLIIVGAATASAGTTTTSFPTKPPGSTTTGPPVTGPVVTADQGGRAPTASGSSCVLNKTSCIPLVPGEVCHYGSFALRASLAPNGLGTYLPWYEGSGYGPILHDGLYAKCFGTQVVQSIVLEVQTYQNYYLSEHPIGEKHLWWAGSWFPAPNGETQINGQSAFKSEGRRNIDPCVVPASTPYAFRDSIRAFIVWANGEGDVQDYNPTNDTLLCNYIAK